MVDRELKELCAAADAIRLRITTKAGFDDEFREEVESCLVMRIYRIERSLRAAGFKRAADHVRDKCGIDVMPFFPFTP